MTEVDALLPELQAMAGVRLVRSELQMHEHDEEIARVPAHALPQPQLAPRPQPQLQVQGASW